MDTKEKILDAAEQAWIDNRGVAPSVRAVCSDAGVNIALVSYYFNSSSGLTEAVIGRCARRLRSRMGIGDIQNDKRLFNIVEDWVRLVSDDRGIRLFIYGPTFSDHPRVVASRSAVENLVRQSATDAMADQIAPAATPEDVVDLVFGPTLYTLLNWGEGIAPEAMTARAFNHLQRMGLNRETRSKVDDSVPLIDESEVTENKRVETITRKSVKPRVRKSTPAAPRRARASLDFID